MTGDAAQFQELAMLYGTYGDQELLTLGRAMSDLTEMAQEALKGEMARRGLTIVAAQETAEDRVLSEDDLSELRAYAALAPPECIFEFEDGHGASAAYLALAEAGIESVVLSEGDSGVDVRGPRVVVAPQDAERAGAILSQPLADRFKTAADEAPGEAPGEFDVPSCPVCGGEETLLESVDPVNEWRCDDCGHAWLEGAGSSVE
jgi:hypothetical protein